MLKRFACHFAGLTRRDLFRQGGSLTLMGALGQNQASAALGRKKINKPLPLSGEIYRNIGVRPLINGRGTFTIITGSQTLPEVKHAMDEASRSFVQMDELMEGVGKKLADITGAEWGIITAGCCAALTHCAAACVAGSNPERMQRLPDLTGMKSEVIIPEYSRNVYDHAIRMVGVRIVEVNNPAELERAFTDRTAMVYILAGPGDDGPLGTQATAAIAKQHGVPLIVDAAAEILTFPNVHLQRGATAVAYSGGKCIRGPQAAGLLLGEKNLLQAAWANSAPHHAFGRSLKVGKEEIMGMLAAVEMWPRRNHEAEWHQWEGWLAEISGSVHRIDGITTAVDAEKGLSNQSPRLRIAWDGAKVGITGQEVAKFLLDTEPRIVLGSASGSRTGNMDSSISITPYQMMPGDSAIIAQRLYAALAKPPKIAPPLPPPSGEPVAVAGQWDTVITFGRGSITHDIVLEQQGTQIVGTHRGEFVSGDLIGSVSGNQVHFRSSQKIEGTRLSYDFTGTLEADGMSGEVDLGEYGVATWSAHRHEYKAPGGVIRPVKRA